MNDRIFTLVNSLLNAGYVLRVVHNASNEAALQWEDFEGGSEETVGDCYHRLINASSKYPDVYVFSAEDWAEPTADATARLEINLGADTVFHHREYAHDQFVINRVKETYNG